MKSNEISIVKIIGNNWTHCATFEGTQFTIQRVLDVMNINDYGAHYFAINAGGYGEHFIRRKIGPSIKRRYFWRGVFAMLSADIAFHSFFWFFPLW